MGGAGGAAAGGPGAAGKTKRSKQPLAQLLEVDITGAPVMPQRAPVARDASVDPLIGRYIQYASFATFFGVGEVCERGGGGGGAGGLASVDLFIGKCIQYATFCHLLWGFW